MKIGEYMKKWKILIFIILFFSFPSFMHATTREDIVNYVGEKETMICDQQTKSLFQSYRLLFTRMLKEKNLNEKDLNAILRKLTQAMTLIEQNDVCKKADLNTIPKEVKEKIKSYLYDGMMIIYDAPPLEETTESIGENGIVIDKNTNTVDIYQNGNLYDKVELLQKTFTSVGPNKIIFWTLLSFGILLCISLFTYLISRNMKWKYKNLVSDFSLSLFFIMLILTPLVYLSREKVSYYLDLTSMLKKPTGTSEKKIVIDENHEIISYPSYGDFYATLKIPSVQIERKIKFGDSSEILQDYIGHTTTSFLPGENGTILMSGHNRTDMLGNLKNVLKGSEIVLETTYGIFTYEVSEIKTMQLEEYANIEIKTGEETLILYTCYPFGGILYGNERFVVTSKLKDAKWER